MGWSIVVVGIAALGTVLIVKYGEVKKIETDDVSLCFIIAFFCWLIPIIAFTILARTLGFYYQASARGGVIRVRVDGDRVHLGGQAVTVLRGELAIS